MLREKLGEELQLFRHLVEVVSGNVTKEIRTTVARRLLAVCSDEKVQKKVTEQIETLQTICSEENRLKVLARAQQVEKVIEDVPVIGSAYQYSMGIKNIWNVRYDDRNGIRSRFAEVLFPDGDPRHFEKRKSYENFVNKRSGSLSSKSE